MSASADLHDVCKTRLPLGVSCNQCLHRAVLEHDSRLRQASPRPEFMGDRNVNQLAMHRHRSARITLAAAVTF